MSQHPHPFLRMQILSFKVTSYSDQCINLSTLKTQIELKEKHRSTRDNAQSNTNSSNMMKLFLLISS